MLPFLISLSLSLSLSLSQGGGNPSCIVTKILECNILISKFQLLCCCYIHFGTNAPWEKGMDPYISPSKDQIVPLPFFQKDWFSIR